MSSSVAVSKRGLSTLLSTHSRNRETTRLLCFPCRMKVQSQTFLQEEGSTKLRQISVPSNHVETIRKNSDLLFDKLQQFDEEGNREIKSFGEFVAREAVIDEEFWTAAWLRAESLWEDRSNERYAESYKRQYAEQVKKEDKTAKHTVIKSVVGTLDLSIQFLLQGESFPGERIKAPPFCRLYKNHSRYGYVSNLCVAKSSRRKGVAINMLKFATETAKVKGAGQIFVHVYRNNKTAQSLYEKLGFEIVEMASPQLAQDQMYLLCFQI